MNSPSVARRNPAIAGVGDYLELMKPRVMLLAVFTALVGLLIAPVHLHPVIAFTALVCIAVGAGAAGALNMWYDADIDALMERTRRGRFRSDASHRVKRSPSASRWRSARW